MPLSKQHHGAHYDDDGNIIIDAYVSEQIEPKKEPRISRSKRTSNGAASAWTTTSLDEPLLRTETPEDLPSPWAREAMTSLLTESALQLQETEMDVQNELNKLRGEFSALPARTRALLKNMWQIALTPCLGRVSYGRKAVPRSRLTLFVIDTVRFGTTFALIFGVLFVSINFQSFWNIAKAELALNEDLTTVQALQKLTQGDEEDAPLIGSVTQVNAMTPGLSGQRPALPSVEGSLLAVLPPVGPPENRLIIPKIGENVPIVIPAMDSLLNEDWKQFEKDIQDGLRQGVVHYPGTARPGQAGNFFITGHSSYYPWDPGLYKDVFARLHELEVGDTYSVYYGGDLHTYRVAKKYEVKPSDVTVLDQPTDKRLATLMTCTPIGTTLRRLIVQSEEVDPVTGQVLKAGQRGTTAAPQPSVDMLPI